MAERRSCKAKVAGSMPVAGTTNTLEQSMSKQSEAKAAQGYTTAVRNCGNCARLTSETTLPRWMANKNAERECLGLAPHYRLPRDGVEKNFRCAVGGFAVKKTATCTQHSTK